MRLISACCPLGDFIFSRYGAWASESWKHLLHELFAPGLGSLSLIHQVAGGIYRPEQSGSEPGGEGASAVQDPAAASKG